MESRANIIIRWKALNDNYADGKAKKYENLCQKNISQYYSWIKEEKKSKNFQLPTQVDAFKYLAMLYEKQGKFKEAIAVCDEAIAAKATYDGTKGGIEGRKKRLKKNVELKTTQCYQHQMKIWELTENSRRMGHAIAKL